MLRTARSVFPLLFVVLAHPSFLIQRAMLGCSVEPAAANRDQLVECTSPAGVPPLLGGRSSDDPEGNAMSLAPTVFWPPNHKLVPVTVSVPAADACDPSPTLRLVSIASNEGELANGTGHTSPDIQDAQFGTDDRQFLLRAERRVFGPGRIYTIRYEAEDANGNLATRQVTVAVP